MKTLRRPIFWFKTAMWIVSIVLSALLIQLGSLVMSDIPTADTRLSPKDFVNMSQLQAVEAKIHDVEKQLEGNRNNIEDAEFQLKYISIDYNTQRSNFNNWIRTRSITKARSENPEVVERVKILETIKASERKANQKLAALEKATISDQRLLSDLQSDRRRIMNEANAPYQRAKNAEILKIFLFRLVLTIPLLLVSGWLILKKRKSKYWPVYRGFIIFSFFAFFVELVPYLPSYGGYIRYAGGIILSLMVAHLLLKWRERYLKTKENEQNQSEKDKRSQMNYETAVKKISSGVCPSCDRSYAGEKSNLARGEKNDFCVHCGFSLFDNCGSCGTRANSFYKFCGTCGTSSTTQMVETGT